MVVVVDYGMGNIGSILNMFRYLGAEAVCTSLPEGLEQASHLVLPGVGAFDEAMDRLRQSGLDQALHEMALVRKKPTLGICLGLQLMTEKSEEGVMDGFGWFSARTVRFADPQLRVPHIGWNRTHFTQAQHPLAREMEGARFYYLHSYQVQCQPEASSQVLAVTDYGGTFASALCRDNLFGAQFHPEKSHRYGKQLFRNFLQV